jgi:hypothetical protein
MTVPGPLVSIVIPVYNGADYLREAIDSALAQTYDNCEVLVVNDGSTDNGVTESIALSYGDRIRYFRKENGGVASALNLGIREMRGELFSWLSHDDAYLPDKCRAQVEFWRQCGDVRTVIYADIHIVDARGEITDTRSMPDMTEKDALCRIWGSSFLNGCAMLIPRSLLLEAGGFNESLPTTQDHDLWLRLALVQKANFRRYPGVVLLSRHHGGQGSQLHIRAHRRECAKLFSDYVPHVLQHVRGQEGGFAAVAPLLARGIARRAGDYGLMGIEYLYIAFRENALITEKKQLVPLVLRQMPYVWLLWMWLCLPLSFRIYLRSMLNR